MLNIIINLIIVLYLIFSLIQFKLNSPINIFLLFWSAIVTAYNTKLYPINNVDSYTIFIIFLGITSFVFGYLISNIIPMMKKNKTYIKLNEKYILVFLITIIILYMPTFFTQFFNFLSTGSIQANKIGLVLNEVNTLGFVGQYIIRPASLLFSFILPFILVNKCNYRKVIIILITILKIMEFIVTGSKGQVLQIAVFILVLFISKKKNSLFNNSLLKKAKKYAFAIFSFILIYMTLSKNLLESLFYYLCGCIPMLEYAVNQPVFLSSGYTYGFTSLHGVFRVISKLFSIFNINIWVEQLNVSLRNMDLLEYTFIIAPDKSFNSLSTIFYSFYYDLGLFGVFVGSFVLGFISLRIYKSYINNSDIYHTFLYLFIIYIIINSEAKFMLYSVVEVMCVIYALVLFKFFFKLKVKVH